MRDKLFFALGFALLSVLGMGLQLRAGGLWQNTTSDVDADGYYDLISYNVGGTGEHATMMTYAPDAMLHTPRLTDYGSCMEIGNLEEVIHYEGVSILATCRPRMVGANCNMIVRYLTTRRLPE